MYQYQAKSTSRKHGADNRDIANWGITITKNWEIYITKTGTLGPLLFLLYINDLPNNVLNGKVIYILEPKLTNDF